MFTNEEAGDETQIKDPLAGLDMIFINDSKKIFEPLTGQASVGVSKGTSKKERNEKDLPAASLVYGEILFDSFAIVLEKIKKRYGKAWVGTSGADGIMQKAGGNFYDLGSGSGKCVVAAAILHNFSTCCGVEVMSGLHSLSCDLKNIYDAKGKTKLLDRDQATELEFYKGDFLNVRGRDWRDADVVFCNTTCFDDELMNKINDRSFMLKKGAFVVTVTKRMPSKVDFMVLEYEMFPMTWGYATIYIHQKVTEPHEAREEEEEQ